MPSETLKKVQAGRVEEVPPGQTRFLCVEDRAVLLANWNGRIYALKGICPHRKNPLDGAQLWDNLIDCPWHHFQYDVVTGENHFPRNVYPAGYSNLQEQLAPLETYTVEVVNGEIWIHL